MKSKLVIDILGNKEWKLSNGRFHRENSPAVEWNNGSKEWWLNGLRHREDGPAIEYYNGSESWWINSIKYTEQEYKLEMRSRKLTKLLLE
jgi:hypothetical protein